MSKETYEKSSTLGWERNVGDEGQVLDINHFGALAPGESIIKEFGITVEKIVAKVKELLEGTSDINKKWEET
ncbi:MAG: transketolase-like TK C-terminal-containing protein [Bacillota bacterium]